jgi:DNA-binding transcriptional ArsR family regulator
MQPATFGALGEPSRLRIVELLRTGPLSVGDIAAALGIRQPQVSKHLRVLGEVEMVSAEWSERRRIYHLRSEPFEQIRSWVDSFEGTWEARLASLDAYLRKQQQTPSDPEEPQETR